MGRNNDGRRRTVSKFLLRTLFRASNFEIRIFSQWPIGETNNSIGKRQITNHERLKQASHGPWSHVKVPALGASPVPQHDAAPEVRRESVEIVVDMKYHWKYPLGLLRAR